MMRPIDLQRLDWPATVHLHPAFVRSLCLALRICSLPPSLARSVAPSSDHTNRTTHSTDMSQKGRKGAVPARAPAASKPAPRAAAAPAASKAPAQKRKRAPEPEPEEEDDEDDDDDLAGLLEGAAGEGDEDDEEDGEDGAEDDDDEEDLDVDPQEFLALQRRAAAAAGKDDEEEEDDEEDDAAMDGESSEDDGAEYADDGTGTIARPAKRAKTDEKPKKVFLNNKAALEDKLADIRLRSDYPWVETLELVTAKSFAETTDHATDAVHDDLKREAALSATTTLSPLRFQK